MVASSETPDTTTDLDVQARNARHAPTLLKHLVWGLLGVAAMPAFWWLGVPLTETLHAGDVRHGTTANVQIPDFSSILLYGGVLLVGLVSVALLGSVVFGLVRGLVVADCPACKTTVLVGADRRVKCTGCDRQLSVTPPST